jgi:DNA-binding beta-propeller fold protein YncE
MAVRATSAARLGVLVTTALCAVLPMVGCGTGGSGTTGSGTTPQQTDASNVATPAATPAAMFDRAETERRLALPRFTYVGEEDRPGTTKSTGALAFIDSETDTLAFRPRMGSYLSRVAVAPDGRLIYVTDRNEPVVWVVDAETHEKLRSIRLPGVSASHPDSLTYDGRYTFAQIRSCSDAVACTPDGSLVLVLDKAGLQVIDTASSKVVRTLPELRDGYEIAVSFDGTHAYIATSNAAMRGRLTLTEWAMLSIKGVGGGLALLDLETWQVVKRVKCGEIGGLAVDPDDSRIFCSDRKLKALRIVDPVTLADIAVVSLRSDKAKRFQPRGVGVLPDGSKVYVVCADTSAPATPSPNEYFCAVVEAKTQEVVKRIPLDAY